MTKVLVTFTAAAQVSDTISIQGLPLKGYFDLSINGAFTGSINLERQLDASVGWEVTDTFTAPISAVGIQATHGVPYRLHCTALTSGTPTGLLSQ